MKIFGLLARIGVGVVAAFTLVASITGALFGRDQAAPSIAGQMKSRRGLMLKTAAGTLGAVLLLAAAGGFLFMASGFYDIAANEPHIPPVSWFLTTGRTRSVEFHSRGIQVPPLNDPELVKQGLVHYRTNCLVCHGAPGVEREQLGRGINPSPPPLVTAVHNWTDPQLYWIISNGLKMSGMPAFNVRLSHLDRLAVMSFVRRLPLLTPIELQKLAIATDLGAEGVAAALIFKGDRGFAQLDNEGRPERGRELLRTYGCITCHAVPNVSRANVGPPLARFAERQYIAGALVNTPAELVGWIVDPQRYEPNTAMPNLGVSPEEALHLAAYLYTLGDQKRLNGIRQVLTQGTVQEARN